MAYRAIGTAFEVIPRTLALNCGANVIRTLTKLKTQHAEPGRSSLGINGNTGLLTDMKELGIWEPLTVKAQGIKTAIESTCMLLRIDDIVSGISTRNNGHSGSSKVNQKNNSDFDSIDTTT